MVFAHAIKVWTFSEKIFMLVSFLLISLFQHMSTLDKYICVCVCVFMNMFVEQFIKNEFKE